MNRAEKPNKKPILLALLINVLTALVCFVVFSSAFETNDDTGLISIASGTRGFRDPHLVHTNYLFGKLITALNAAFPEVQWWSLLQIFLLFLSFFLITLVFLKKDQDIVKVLFITAMVFFFSYEGYVQIQYTKTAGILSAAGLMLVFCGLLQKKTDKLIIVLGLLLAIAGSFYRFQEFFCIAAVFAAMVVYAILYFIKEFEEPSKRITAALAVGAILLLAVGGFRVYDRNQYKDPEWAAYLEFDKYRTQVLDYGVPDYDDHEEEYNAAGIDRTAYKLMKKWTFQDTEKFTAETFKTIAGFREKKTINGAFIKGFFRAFAKGACKEGTFLCFLIAAAAWLIIGRHKARNWISIMVLVAMIVALHFYLYYAGRFLVNRVDVGIWFAAALIILYQCFIDMPEYDSTKEEKKGGLPNAAKTVVITALCLVTAAAFVYAMPWHDCLRSALDNKPAEIEKTAIEKIGSDKDHLYLTKVGTLKFSEAYGVFDPMPYEIADNIFPLGGWGSATPTYTRVLKKYGISNPFRDMIGNEKIYLVDNKINDTLDYLRKWYKPDAEAELVDTVNGHKIYRIN